MAYRRPLTPWQMALFAILWLGMVVWILTTSAFSGSTILLLVLSGFLVFYPIVKSWRQRRGK